MTLPSETSAAIIDSEGISTNKKKKKKSGKKKPTTTGISPVIDEPNIPETPVLRISRNKHWKYVSSYHVSHLSALAFYPL